MRGWKKRKEHTVTFMIGNGFDLNLGLPTSYDKFYTYYTAPENCANDSLVVESMKLEISKNLKNWSDLELALGEYTSQLANFEECNECFVDITLQLEQYLKESCNLPDDLDIQKVREISTWLPTELAEVFRVNRSFHQMIGHFTAEQRYTNINIINFNFTSHVENLLCSYFEQFENKLLGKKPKSIKSKMFKMENDRFHTQIHGNIGQSPIIGVDNVDQLAIYREGRISKEEAELFAKKVLNSYANRGFNTEYCMEQLKHSDIIFVYGMAIGATDRIWWDAIMSCLESPKVNLVINDFQETDDVYSMYGSRQCYDEAQFQKYRIDRRRELLKRLSPDKKVSDSINERIHIIPNSDIFLYMQCFLKEKLPEKE